MGIATLISTVCCEFNFNANPHCFRTTKVLKQSCDWVIASNATAIQDVVSTSNRVGRSCLESTNLDVEVYSLAGLQCFIKRIRY